MIQTETISKETAIMTLLVTQSELTEDLEKNQSD